MFLSLKEMELRKVRFDEAFPPGQMDFSAEGLEQQTPLQAKGSAEVLAHSDGEVRIQGRYAVEMVGQCDRCLSRSVFPLDAGFDLFYRPMSVIARDEEVEIDESETEIGFYEGMGWSWRMCSGNRYCWRCRCSGCAARRARESARCAAGTGTKRVRLPRGDRGGALGRPAGVGK